MITIAASWTPLYRTLEIYVDQKVGQVGGSRIPKAKYIYTNNISIKNMLNDKYNIQVTLIVYGLIINGVIIYGIYKRQKLKIYVYKCLIALQFFFFISNNNRDSCKRS